MTTGLAPRSRDAHPIEQWLFSRRGRFTQLIVIAIIALLILLALGILGVRILGGSAAATVSDSLSALLAVGTLSLAYAAGFQAVVMDRMRLAAIRPCLNIQIREQSRIEDPAKSSKPLMVSVFFTKVDGSRGLQCVIRNMGPGHAIGVQVRGPVWYVNGDGPWEKATAPPPVVDDLPPPEFDIVEDRSLHASEDYEFEIPIAFPYPGDTGVERGTYKLVQRLQMIATCRDVEGNQCEAFSLQVDLQQITPATVPTVVDLQTRTSERAGRGYELLWKISTPSG